MHLNIDLLKKRLFCRYADVTLETFEVWNVRRDVILSRDKVHLGLPGIAYDIEGFGEAADDANKGSHSCKLTLNLLYKVTAL